MNDRDDDWFRIRHGDRASGYALLLLGLYLVYEAYQLEFGTITRPGPGFFPLILAVLLTLLSMLVILNSARSGSLEATAAFERQAVQVPVLIVAVMLYVIFLEMVGFLICSVLLLLLLLRALGKVSWRMSLSVAVIGTAISYGLFRQLGISLPLGVIPL